MNERRRHSDWSVAAERRATESSADRAGSSRAVARRAADAPALRSGSAHEAPPPDGLTRRERKVRDLLLRELKKLGDSKLLSYAEIQHLEKRLSVPFIDRELEKMRRQHSRSKWLWLAYIVIFGAQAVIQFMEGTSFAMGLAIAMIMLGGLGPFFTRKAIQRKIFIYEALRELAGADEAGVTLDQAVQEADALISRIVDRELAADSEMPARTVGRIRLN